MHRAGNALPMPTYKLRVNGRDKTVDSWDPNQPLLYVLRDTLGFNAPKFGCGLGQCGACTVTMNGQSTVFLGVQPLPTANTIEVVKGIRADLRSRRPAARTLHRAGRPCGGGQTPVRRAPSRV